MVLVERNVPEDWENSFIVLILKDKRDVQEFGNSIVIKLMSNLGIDYRGENKN